MHGARGLLISITGGRDMTLFEVDEAATRIREEVDQDANIILGATFDEQLEGVIRVSVVATGIDKAAAEVGGSEIISKTVISNVRANNAALEPKREPATPRDVIAEKIQQAEEQNRREAAARTSSATAGVSEEGSEAATAQTEDFRPRSKLFTQTSESETDDTPEFGELEESLSAAAEEELLPAETPQAVAASRMPRVEDFPPVVKAEIAAQEGHVAGDERGPMGLLKRLTHGLSRKEEETERAELRPAQHARQPVLKQASAEDGRSSLQDPKIYAPKQAKLDDLGRAQLAKPATHDDDQLEIPAFLRRQAN